MFFFQFLFFIVFYLFIIIGCGLEKIEFEDESITLFENETRVLKYREVGLKRINEQVFFSSDDEEIVKVTEGGRVVGKGVGEAKVSAFSSYNVEIKDMISIRVTN